MQVQPGEPFAFQTEWQLVLLTGRKARNLPELVEHLRQVSGASVFYHTHSSHLLRNFEKPRFYNDFANWVSRALQEERLAERLAAIDLLAMTSIREIREAIIAIAESHLEGSTILRQCPQGDEFHFLEAQSFFMPTGLVAHNIAEFFEQLDRVTNACLHFHFFEARLRLERPTNDFSRWLRSQGEPRLARAIDWLNPYSATLDELREQIVKIGRRRLRK